jgi:hypothetical protein
VFFAGHGLQVVATDLSPKMVACCREKGLDARVMDLLHLDFHVVAPQRQHFQSLTLRR